MQMEQFRETRVSDAKNDLQLDTFEVVEGDDWPSLYNALDSDYVDEYASAGDFVPANPEQVRPTNIVNRTNTGMTLEEAYVAYDMRESFIQRHVSSMGMQADQTELETKDFKTKSCNQWRSND